MFKFQVSASDYAEMYADSIISESVQYECSSRITMMFANDLVEEVKERIAISGENAPADIISRSIEAVSSKYETAANLINRRANAGGHDNVLVSNAFKKFLKECYPITFGPHIRGV